MLIPIKMEKKYFSLNEAENLIPVMQNSINRIKDITKAISLLESIEITSDDEFKSISNEIMINKSFHKLNFLFFKELEQLLKSGAVIKDPNEGLVDFYSFYEGREIFLCWKLGERDIKFWHEISTGYSSRKPIALLRKNSN